MALRSLRKEFGVAVGAGESAIRINSDEIDDALHTLTEVAKSHGWELRVWDHTSGVTWYNGEEPPKPRTSAPTSRNDVAEALQAMAQAQSAQNDALVTLLSFLDEKPKPDPAAPGEVQPVILVLKNFHIEFERDRGPKVSVVQHLVGDKVGDHPKWKEFASEMSRFGISDDSDAGKFVVGIMPQEARLPPEISPLFKVITHELPDEEELGKILDGIIEDNLITEEAGKKACKHALGLTRLQAAGVFSSALVRHGDKEDFSQQLPVYVWQDKSQILNDEGLVTLYQGKETFADVVGLNGLKKLLTDLLAPDKYDPNNTELRSKGVALVGPPRTGKSLTVKALGNELGRPTLMVDVGRWFGQYVGNTEASTRKGFQIIRAHAPCVAIIDEVEKTMPSADAKGNNSGDVGMRMAGTFMQQLQDIEEDVFWGFTANGVDNLHEAFLADDRVDATVYVRMPGPSQRAAGWKMYLGKFFPPEVKGKAFPLYAETELGTVCKDLKNTKKVDPLLWANRCLPGLLCLHGDARQKGLDKVQSIDENVFQTLEGLLFSDEGWTIARIKSVCRLARKRNMSLAQVARMMPRRSRKLDKAIDRLERWAEDEAIDAETGEAYTIPDSGDEEGNSRPGRKHSSGRVRRKVRRLAEAQDD